MAAIPLFGLGTGTKSSNVSKQTRLNMYAERLPEPDKTAVAYYGRPGLTAYPYTVIPNLNALGPIRGLLGYNDNNGDGTQPAYPFAYLASGSAFVWLQLGGNGQVTAPDGPLGTGPVRFAFDGSRAFAVDGQRGYHMAGLITFVTPDANFPNGAESVTFLASRYFVDDPSVPGRFRWSDLLDGQSWPALNFATAESNPDPLTGVFEARGELLLFGTQTLEFWAPTGGTDVVARIGSSGLMWGTLAYDAIQKVGDSVVFMGANNSGDRKVLRLDGYQATVISTPDIEKEIQADPNRDAAVAVVMNKAGHTFYVLNLTDRSWAYDVTTGNWDEWQTEDGRYAGQWYTAAFNELLVSDYRDQRIYTVDADVVLDDQAMIVREITSRHQFSPDLERMSLYELVVDCETGVGTTTGQGVDPQIMLQISKDGGHTWGNELWMTLGALGSYLTRAVWRRLGFARDWLFKLRVTDPVKVVVIGATARFDK